MVVARERGGLGRWGGWKGALLAIVVLALIVAAVIALFDWLADDDIGALRGVTVSEIYANPQAFYDEDDITVSGEVSRVLHPFAYTIGGEAFGGQELLVVGPPPAVVSEERTEERPILRSDIVQIAGELRPFQPTAIEEEIGADLDEERFAQFEGEPVLVAASTALTPRFPLLGGEFVSVEEVLEDPEEWFDDTVTVSGEVVRVLGPNLFVFAGEEGNELVVVDATGDITGSAAVEANVVQVSGPVVPFDLAAVEALAGVELDEAVATDLAGYPTIVGRAIRVI